MVAVGDRQAASALAGEPFGDLLTAARAERTDAISGIISVAISMTANAKAVLVNFASQFTGSQSPPGTGSAANASSRPSAAAIAARSRTLGHITTTVPIAIIRPPAHSQKTSGVRNTSKVASPL
jgi:hypothetical protein